MIHPVTILSTLPSAGVGAVLALLMFKTEFSLIAMIGVILLIGIVKKNAIIMIDFAIEAQRRERLELARRDLQGLPAALPPHHDDDHRAPSWARCRWPSAWAKARSCASRSASPSWAGCSLSQILTLYTTPVVYLYWTASAMDERVLEPLVSRHDGSGHGRRIMRRDRRSPAE